MGPFGVLWVSLNTVELIVIHNSPCEHSSELQVSIRFTPSRCLDVRQDWYPMYYPEGMKARVGPVQSIEPHRILAFTRDSNQEPPGPGSRVVTNILPLHTIEQFELSANGSFLRKTISPSSLMPADPSHYSAQGLNVITQ